MVVLRKGSEWTPKGRVVVNCTYMVGDPPLVHRICSMGVASLPRPTRLSVHTVNYAFTHKSNNYCRL